MRSRHLLASTAALGLSLALAQPAFAQDQAPADQATGTVAEEFEDAEGDTIIVTGSRIARPTLESPVPVTSVEVADLMSTGNVSLGDALNDLPQLRGTFSQANSTRFIGTSGLNVLDLRGLGTARTLVLVNGRRHVTASPGDYLVDTNTIPEDLLERVDIVTGGNSAIYGSDAIAGVVNFILKRNYEGISLKGQGGVTDKGDRGSYFASLTAGQNFGDGRGNIAGSVEYAKQDALYNRDRDGLTGAFSGRSQFNLAEPTAGEPATGDGIPDNQFFTGVRNALIADGGLITANATAATCATLAPAVRALRCLPNGQPRLFAFDANGNLVESVPTVDFRPFGSNNFVGGLGSTLRNTGQLNPDLERISVNLLAHYDISDAFKPFVEAKYVRITANQEGQPSFFQGGLLGTFSCSNPFLTAQALATLQSVGRCATPAGTFALNRFNVDFGGRGELHKRETFRIVGGVEGNFNEDWKYEVALNYGQLDTSMRSLNNLQLFDIDGNDGPYLKAINAVRNPAGQIVCGVNADADTTNDDPACVPINPFGFGAPSQAALDYVNTEALRDEKATEFVASAYMAGDSSQLFELPGGPVAFAVGGEYRRETARSVFDPLTASGATFLNAIQPFEPPAFEVLEAFGEINVPVLKDLPWAKELTLSAAARYSDYNTATDKTFAYNFSGVYAPIPDLRFRANWARSVRAPTQSDLFSPASQNFALLQDPCDVLFINTGKPTRPANCAAAGIPAGFVNVPARASSTSFLQGGNPNLKEETSDSYTIGAVIEPRFLPGFSLTIDYYHIKVDDLIATVTAQNILNTCYDSADINNAFCALIFRNPDFTFADPAVLAAPVNFAKQKTSGYDLDMAYNHMFDNGDKLAYRVIAAYIKARTNYLNVLDPNEPNRVKSELGDPTWEFQASVTYETGPVSLRYEMQYIGPQTIGTWEDQHSYNGLPPLNPDRFPRVFYPEVFYHDIRASVDVTDKVEVYGGVDNLTDRKPPLGLLGNGTTGVVTSGDAIYDNVGRFFYFGIKANF